MSKYESVFIIVLNDKDEILFYEEQKSWGIGKLRLPGGDIEKEDKDIFDTAKREIREEFDAEIKIIGELGHILCNFDNVNYKNHIVIAKLISKQIKANLKENVANPVWLTLEKYDKIPLEKTFIDMKRVIEIYKKDKEIKA